MKDKKLKEKVEKTFGWNPEDGDYSVAKERRGEKGKKQRKVFKNLKKKIKKILD